jgi:hypothetical protein
LVSRDAQVFYDVSDDSARHITRKPRKSDNAVGAEWIRVMAMAPSIAQVFTSDFAEATF